LNIRDRKGRAVGCFSSLLAWAALAAVGSAPGPAAAQQLRLRAYYLNVGSWEDASPYGPGGAFDFQRLRLMLTPREGPVTLDLAYEHTLLWNQRAGASLSLQPGSAAAAPVDWLHLDWTADRGAHHLWRHRIDRLSASVALGPSLELTLGRQPISWATTLYFTPTDPFAPFDPTDPFREYRTGVDAARLQYFAGPFTTLDLVVRPEDTPEGYRTTALARARTTIGAWDLSAWAGALHEEAAGAVGVDRSVAGWAVRADVGLRRASDGGAVLRAAAGADRRFGVLGRDLHFLAELQHDGLGATSSDEFASVLASPAYRRGELQALGRDEALVDASWQLHPLVATELLAIANLRDGSTLLAPAASVSLSDEVAARLGLYVTAGDGSVGALGLPRSEYGAVPAYLYLSFTAFF